jgi:chitodextrinase
MRIQFSRAAVAVLTTGALIPLGIVAGASAAHADPVPTLGQHTAVPAYIPPTDTTAWNQIATSGSQLGFVVANVANGPDNSVNTAWKSVIDTTHNSGVKVLGYVDTGYFGATTPPRYTVLGDTSATAWLVQAQQDINRWYDFYGSSIDGIFFDDGLNTCGPTPGSQQYVDLYRELNDYVHKYHFGSLTVVNPGVGVPNCYEDAADIIITFEGNYSAYLNPTGDYVTQQWQLNSDPNKFWHLVYDVPQSGLATVLDKSKQNNAGYIYVTPDSLPNPWDTMPSSSYWSAELSGTQVTDPTTPLTPQPPYSSNTAATSVHLGWDSDPWNRAAGYDVYQGSTKIGSVGNFTPADTDFSVRGLQPSTQYTFKLKGRTLAGTLSGFSSTFTVTTAAQSANAPTAPGSLTTSDLAPTSVRLTWNASTDCDSGDYVEFYDVYQDNVRVLTVNSSITSVRLGFMTPETQHSFKVYARDRSGRSSAASNTVTITTPAPPGGPIANPAADLTSANATLSAQYNLPFTFHNVFIDTDNNANTGYAIAGIGADRLIQDGSYYQHAGGTGWNWSPVSGVNPLQSSTGGLYQWQVPTSTLGTGVTSIKVVFNGSGSSPDYFTAIVTANIH